MLKRSVGRPRDGNPAETRRGILRAAEESFATAGFVGATTRQVAARAGVNVATLHYHFGNKAKLYRAVLDAASGAASGAEITVPGENKAPADRLASVVEALWDLGAARPALPRLSLLHRLAGPPSSANVPLDPRVTLLTRVLAETGAQNPYPSGGAARVILAFLDSALVASQDGSDFASASASPSPSASASASASRSGVVAAALRVAGLA